MKGRYFFWIPFFIWLIYLVYPTLVCYKDSIIDTFVVINVLQAASSLVALGIYLTLDNNDKEEMQEDLIKTKWWFLLIPYMYIILGINYIFDKYLTIKR